MTPDGRFDVAWEQTFSATDHDIYLNRYSASGGLLGTNTVAFSTADDSAPSVSMDNSGNAVVAWNEQRTTSRRGGSARPVARGPRSISPAPRTRSEAPSVALKPGGGGFVVAYRRSSLGDLRNLDFRVAEVSAFDTVTTFDAGRGAGAVSIDAFGDYLLTYTAFDAGGDTNIHSRRGRLPV